MTGELASRLHAVGSIGLQHVSSSNGPDLAPWQVINLVGSVLLALLFVGPVIDDLQSWARARKQED